MNASRLTVLLTALSLAPACLMGDELDIGDEQAEIVGGVESTGFDQVVFITSNGFACTATLIGKRLLLTAAHCVVGDNGDVFTNGSARFGNNTGAFFATRQVARYLPNRRYNPAVVRNFDIAFARLTQDAPEELVPYAVNLDTLTEADIGQMVRVVGFGVVDGASQTGAGTKREISLSIDELTNQHIGLGNATKNICQGDSGGPTLVLGGAVPTVYAVSSFGSNECMNRSFVARTDAFPEFVRGVMSAWGDGECAEDGTCNSNCTEFVDPDCDPCGLDGTCATGCAQVDLDCPLSGIDGDFCADNDSCESRLCVEAADDPRVKYCSKLCDESDADSCEVPQTCVAGECRFVTPTPSAQGSNCSDNTQCRSQICDTQNRICVEPCSSDAECGEEFACESFGGQKVCTVPGEGGGCCGTTGGWKSQGGTGVLLILLMIGYGAAARRRRALGKK